ncbi:MAG: NusG domain II-containing protein [Clostridiales bacterium]|jgi:hypothetical protein|nr:NusG domain II-containing protein [Clostridiales bacterium]
MKNRFWILLITVILILSAAAAVYIYTHKTPGRFAEITQDGVLIRTVDLNQDAEFTIESPSGGYNRIRVENGAISVVEASCPDKVCIRQGAISDGAQPIVCLPNKLVIKITSPSRNAPDAIAG